MTVEPLPLPDPADSDAAFRQAEVTRLQVQLQELEHVLAAMSQELRNPVHALALQLQMARTLAEARSQGEIASRIGKAQSTLARYGARVSVLLDLARFDDAYPFALQALDLSEAVRTCAAQLEPEAAFRGIVLDVDVPPGCKANADPLVVDQLVGNLVLNALKHSNCTTVTVSLRVPRVGWAQIVVADDGQGIDPHDQLQILGRAEPVAEASHRVATGLGLWIVRKLATAAGGSITLDSQSGKGSVFTLELPTSDPPRQSP